MLSPVVVELPRRLEGVSRDTFLGRPASAGSPVTKPAARRTATTRD
jgi:hypothetical protein